MPYRTTPAKQTSSRLWKDSARAHFERWAGHYDRDLINIILFEPSYRHVLTQLRQWYRRGMGPMRILDVGCGTGTLGTWCMNLGPAVRQVVGLDMSENMIARARAKAARLPRHFNGRLRFLVGDAEHLPFPDASFDVVTCCNSFHHYPHQQRAVREMRRVLNDHGRLILIDGYCDDPWGYFIFEICVARAESHVHHCTRSRLGKMIRRVGFRRLEQRVFGLAPPALMNVAYV